MSMGPAKAVDAKPALSEEPELPTVRNPSGKLTVTLASGPSLPGMNNEIIFMATEASISPISSSGTCLKMPSMASWTAVDR